MIKQTQLKMRYVLTIFFSLSLVFFISANALASISYTPESPKVGETVTFTVTPPSGSIVSSIDWDFGDGSIETRRPPDAQHTYSASGTYTVRATYKYRVVGVVGRRDIVQTDTTSITVAPAPTPSICYSPSHPIVGEVITFTGHNFSSTTCIKWNFGDGTITNDNSPPSITHIFIHPGSYTVKAYDNCGGQVTATTTVSVGGAERSISYSPSDPRVNEELTFKANNFFSREIKWDLGDGTIIPQGTTTHRHTYKSAGTYIIKAWDYYGQQRIQTTQETIPPVTTQITISPDIRVISYSPIPALATKEITFTASNFRSSCIKWDFGDGTIVARGSPVETHIYEKGGTYTVTAYDRCGEDKFPKSLALKVLPRIGPAAPFSISSVRLRFKDGKAYKQVPKGFTPLVAFADIKSEGTGILEAEWLVDGMQFKRLSQSLSFARLETINSGTRVPLPTGTPGIHEVTLNIIHPKVDYKIPTIRYFVSLEEVEKRVELSISRVRDLGGEIITVEKDHLSLTSDTHYLFSGTIQNISKVNLPSCLLQISLADKVIDQQMIKNLGPREKRIFETSILNDAIQEKKLTLRVFDISAEEKMLDMRELRIVNILPPVIASWEKIEPVEVGATIRGEGYCLKFNIGSNRPVRFKLTIGEDPPVPGGSSGPFFKNCAWWGGWDSGSTPTKFWQHFFCATTPSTIYYYVLRIYDPIFEKYEYMTGAALTAQMDLKITLAGIGLLEDSDEHSGCECEFHAYVNNTHLFQYGNQSNDNWISSPALQWISGFEDYLFDVGRNKETIMLKMRGCDLDDPSGFIFDPETWAGVTHDCAEGSIEIPFSSYRQGVVTHLVSAKEYLSFQALFETEPRYLSRLTSSGQVYQEEHAKYPPPEIMAPMANSVHWDSEPVLATVLVTYPADIRLKLVKDSSPNVVYKLESISKTALKFQNGLLMGRKDMAIEPGRYRIFAQASMSKDSSGGCRPGWKEEGGKCLGDWSQYVVFSVRMSAIAVPLQKKEKEEIKGEIRVVPVEKIKFELLSPKDHSLHMSNNITVKIGSPTPVGFGFKLQEVLPDGVGLKVPAKIDEQKDSNVFTTQEESRWVSTIPLNLDRGVSYQLTVTPSDENIVKGKTCIRFTILTKEAVSTFSKLPADAGQMVAVETLPAPDLMVSQFEVVTLMPGEKALNGTVSDKKRYYFVWTVKNVGDEFAPASKLKIECFAYGEEDCPSSLNKSYDIVYLQPTPPAHIVFGAMNVWNQHPFEPVSRAKFGFRATIDPDNKIVEQKETNNTLVTFFDSGSPIVQFKGKMLPCKIKFELLSPKDHSLHISNNITVKIGSPTPVGFGFKLQEILPDGVGLKVPAKIDEQKDSNVFTTQEGSLWVSTIPLNLDRGVSYQLTLTPSDENIVKGKTCIRFTILTKEAVSTFSKLPADAGQVESLHAPDLVVSEFEVVTLMPGEKALNGTVSDKKRYYFVWTVKNVGDRIAPASKLKIEYLALDEEDRLSIPSLKKSYDIKQLWPKPDEISGAMKVWNEDPFEPVSRAKSLFRATIDPNNEFMEQKETNNSLLTFFDSGAPVAQLKISDIQHIATVPPTVSPSAQVVLGSIGGTATYTITGGQPPYNVVTTDTNFPPSPAAVTNSGGMFAVTVPANSSAKMVAYTVKDSKNETATAILGIALAQQGSGGNQPGPTPVPKFLPDLKPVSLFFDTDCNLMVKIKNVGKGKFVGPRTGFRFFMDGVLVGGASYNLTLFPNSTVTKLVCNRPLLGVWVTEKKSWRYVVNEKGPIQGSSAIYVEESDDTNNSITKEIKCSPLIIKDLRERLPETQPPMPPLPKKMLEKKAAVQ